MPGYRAPALPARWADRPGPASCQITMAVDRAPRTDGSAKIGAISVLADKDKISCINDVC